LRESSRQLPVFEGGQRPVVTRLAAVATT
jgi:hypothetical protein